jgi:16S rRNA (cytosine1402-N4)-methyltransferase
MRVLDGTLGGGGHAAEILKKIGPQGRYIALDQDPQALERCRARFENISNMMLYHENFRNAAMILDVLNLSHVDAVILDIGFSSDQLDDTARGFSFEREGPLDMRMNPAGRLTARHLVNDLSQQELEHIFRAYGEERRSRQFAAAICQARRARPIETTTQLVDVLLHVLPAAFRAPKGRRPSFARRNPTTRVFQALRIAVNDELKALEEALPKLWERVRPGGRMGIITFHSLEDRIVKNNFRDLERQQKAKRVNKKPIVPSREEIEDNSRARSAKLRVIEKAE